MSKPNLTHHQKGFTILELIIATTVFSAILLVASAALIQIGRLYYKGVINSKTQGVARSAIDNITRSIQFSNGSISSATFPTKTYIKAYCFGNTRFTYVLGAQVNSNAVEGSYDTSPTSNHFIKNALWQDRINSGSELCSTDMPDLTKSNPYASALNPNRDGRSLLEENMRLQNFSVAQQSGGDLYTTRVTVVYYADISLVNDPSNPTTCKGTFTGGQWCSISDLTSVVYSRAKP